MNDLSITISTKYDSKPATVKIIACGKIVFDSEITKRLELQTSIGSFDQFNIRIIKSGKSMDVVKKEHEQSVTIEKISLNGIDLKIEEFGKFNIKNNPFVQDGTITTGHLHLNGEWHLQLPKRSLIGHIDLGWLEQGKLRDELGECDVACFGCSQTFGSYLEHEQSWPYQLGQSSGLSVRNFGIGGSNINEITALADHFSQNFSCQTMLLYLPHSYRRQLIVDGVVTRVNPLDVMNKELLMNGEEHSIAVLSGQLKEWLDKISSKTKILFGTWSKQEDLLYRKTMLKDYMIPFLDGRDYPTASDGQHHGAEFNQDFAKIVEKLLQSG